MVLTRFAPSPTGYIHIGNMRTALICYAFAKSQGGQFMLRLDDTDTERSKEEFATQIEKDLNWIGLEWDVKAKQSERLDRYEEIKQQLISNGLLYPCYESAEEIDVKRKMLLNRGLPPIYDRSALSLTKDQIQSFEQEGRKPHWRFKLDQSKTISWNDLIKGETTFQASHLSDPVLIRENGTPTYMLPSAIDDMDFNITHVVRGEDHVSNTAIQIQLFEAIGSHVPTFAHNGLIKSKTGKISKRLGGFDILSLRDSGIEAMTIASFLARIGSSKPVEPRHSMNEILDEFDITHFTRTAANYDPEDLVKLNAKIIKTFSYEDVANRKAMDGVDQSFYDAVRDNLTILNDISEWQQICAEPLEPVIEEDDKEFVALASTHLPQGEWTEETWPQWIAILKQHCDRKGKQLFMPLRKALTAQESGPELKNILPLIGFDKAHARLNGNKA